MSQDSCDDESDDGTPIAPPVKTKEAQYPANVTCEYESPPKESYLKRLTFWNVAFNAILAVTTVFLALLTYWQLETMHLDQRAWVFMKEMRMATLNGDAPIRVDVKLTNSGKTPAFNVNLALSVSIRAPGLMTWMDDLTNRVRRNHPVIFPGSDTYEIIDGEVRPSQEELDKTGQKVLYVVGEIEYRDSFRESHIAEFCGIYRPERGVFYSCNEHQRAN